MSCVITALWNSSPDANPEQAALVSLWERSWRKNGWSPRLLTQRALKRMKKKSVARPVSIYVINFAVPCPSGRSYPVFSWTDPEARTSACVDFSGATVQQILDFGREI